ncbi:MAG: FAD-binding oxidoreductase [Gammaproteobacteria bacterium]|nr:FAD-binding oxidoreductase [Gammaproteobacteria bacterium]
MKSGETPKSYYAATARPLPAFAPLLGAADCDVCVVGAGIAGCSAALHLAERGYRVILLEAQRIGWGASGRSGGQALPGYSVDQGKLAALVGPQTARELWDITVEGLDLIRDLIRRHSINCDWVDGQMHVAVKLRQRRELLAARDELVGDYGYDSVRMVEGDELRSLIASPRYVAGLFDSRSGHLHPLNYTLGLAAAARKLGVVIHEGSAALRYQDGSPAVVHTAHGQVRCQHLVLCGNVYIDGLAPQLGRTIMGVGTYVVATEPLGEARATALLPNNMAVADLNWIIDYFRRSADHRLLFGGRVSYSGLDPAATSGLTRQRMVRVFPQLRDVAIEYSWGGHLDITLNRAPHFGRLAPNVYFLQGFSGHGIVLTGIAGKLIASAVAGTAERFDLFTRIPHHSFPGGMLFRRPALVLAMLYYRLRDLL